MKTKELIQLIVGVVVIVIAGLIIYSQLAPKKTATAKAGKNMVEKITPIPTDYDQDALSKLNDSSKSRDFYTAPDLHNLGNSAPFSPLQ